MKLGGEEVVEVRKNYYSLLGNASVRVRNILAALRSKYPDENVFLEALLGMHYNQVRELRNCGRLSAEGISSIILKLNEYLAKRSSRSVNSEQKLENYSQITEIIDYDKSIETVFQFKLSSLTNRGRHVVEVLLAQSSNSLLSLYSKVNADGFDVRSLHNVGRYSAPELSQFFSDFVEMMRNGQKHETKIEFANQARSIALNKFGLDEESISLISNTEERLGYFPVFTAVNEFIGHCKDEKYRAIIHENFWIYHDKKYNPISEVASYLNISRERVRQLRTIVFEFLTSFVVSLRECVGEKQCPYSYLMVDPSAEVNNKEGTNFNLEFVNFVLSQVYKDVAPCGDPVECLVTKPDKPSFFAAVPSSSDTIFNFKAFVDEMNEITNGHYKDETRFTLKEIIDKHIKVKYYTDDEYNLVEKACRSIIFLFFKIDIDFGQIIIPANAYKTMPERVEEIIRKAGRPLTLGEIFNTFIDLYPEKYTEPQRLRASCNSNPNIIPISRSSTYSLKEWSGDIDKRGGTIREYAFEFLNSVKGHIAKFEEVCDYIIGFRPSTSSSSISANLQAERAGTFSFYFKDGIRYLGLTGDCDNDGFNNICDNANNTRSFEDSIAVASQFIEENHRFPFSSSVPEAEKRISRFLSLQSSRAKQGLLSEHEGESWNQFLQKYSSYKTDKDEYVWRRKFDQYMLLIDRMHDIKYCKSEKDIALLGWSGHQYYSRNRLPFWKRKLILDMNDAYDMLMKYLGGMIIDVKNDVQNNLG